MQSQNINQNPTTQRKQAQESVIMDVFIRIAINNLRDEIKEIEREQLLLAAHIEKIRKEKHSKDQVLGADVNTQEKWDIITAKYKDAGKFYTHLLTEINTETTSLDATAVKEVTNLYNIVRNNYNSMSPLFDGRYEKLRERFADANAEDREKVEKKISDLEEQINTSEENFNSNYEALVHYVPTVKHYKQFARGEIREQLEKENINLDKHTRPILGSSRQRVDRVKFLIYLEEYKLLYKQGKPIKMPLFEGLESFYSTDMTISANKFPEFFKKLTGIDFKLHDQENDLRSDEMRQIHSKEEIKRLSDHERLQLESEIRGEGDETDEEKKALLGEITLGEKPEGEETPRQILRRKARVVSAHVNLIKDPHLNQNPRVLERSKEIHRILYEDALGEGNIFGLIRLTQLPDLDSARPGASEVLKNYAKNRVSEAATAAADRMVAKIDQYEIGGKVRAKSKRVSTYVADKSKFIQRHKEEADKENQKLIMYALKLLIEKSVGKVVDVAKTGMRAIRNSRTVTSAVNNLKGTSFAQGIQKYSTASIGFARDLITKGKLVYRNVLKNPVVVGVMDAGYVTKTALKNAPKGLLYGAGMSSIAIGLGASGGLLPVFIGGSLFGIGLETVVDIMNTPTKRILGGPLRWLQAQGSAIYKDPISKAFSSDLVRNSPRALAGKNINVYGTTGGRLLGAAKSGFSAAMIASTLALLFGIDPLLAAGVAFGTVGTLKFAGQTVAGAKIANRLMSGKLTSLGMLPMNKLMGHVYNSMIVGNLIQEFFEWLKAGRNMSDFFSENFSFGGDKNIFEKFTNLNNYIGTIGYFGSHATLLRFFFGGGMVSSRLASLSLFSSLSSDKLSAFFRLSASSGFLSNISSHGFLRALAMGVGRFFSPTQLIFAASSIAGLALAAVLGVPIGGIGAVIGATVGGLIGTAIGLVLGSGVASIALAAVLNFVGTVVGAWVGSFIDKFLDKTLNGLFAVMSGVSFLFTLIDFLNNKSLNSRKLVTMSISLALAMPTFAAMMDKGSSSQVESSPTIPTPTPGAEAFMKNNQGKLQIVNRTGHNLNENEVGRLSSLISSRIHPSPGQAIYLVFTDSQESNAFTNGESIILTISVNELNPTDRVSSLISDLEFGN